MAGFYDYIPIAAVVLFGIGLVGVMVYERARTRESKEPKSTT